MSRTDENLISIYKRKILRFIFVGIKENGIWQRRSHLELCRSYKESVVVNFIKIQRIKWAGYVIILNEDHTTKKVFNAQPTDTRRKGRPNLRWIDGLEKYFLVLRARNWQEEGWPGKGFLRRPRPTLGCRATEEGRKTFSKSHRFKESNLH
ncbi:uncharacterized protein TNCV_2203951 [Trichonephila clavipes]|nr:uncharacterized protein TNCV_2203951 [Trichonephila clavipes]